MQFSLQEGLQIKYFKKELLGNLFVKIFISGFGPD